ncbi:(2Fe-2S)-binding protein [Ralstonia nicotianae]|uniref:(2Fe-2S)-binding protein n=1 Tax=Ralstonia pseudosolanacearum TaxID=1310165 RepID=UPI000CE51BD4|nr:(2Fe-2S)-binding protein [Ralstonia pseudosolanacearum]MCF1441233.1 (2Fe-2S)-binding protein [Ralstonia solanacearum]
MVTLTINGRPVEVDADPSTPLLWALRDNLGLTGTKFGCGVASCGACTVHLNGQPTRSCVLPISAVVGAQITTSEHIADDKIGKAVLAAWIKHDVAQCGYCQSGQMMSAVGLLRSKKTPTDVDIDSAMAGNLCRCATYQRIRAAIHDAARSLA